MKQYSYFIIFFKFNHSLVPKKDTYIQNFRKFYRFSHNVKLLDALKRIFLAKSELNKSFVMKKNSLGIVFSNFVYQPHYWACLMHGSIITLLIPVSRICVWTQNELHLREAFNGRQVIYLNHLLSLQQLYYLIHLKVRFDLGGGQINKWWRDWKGQTSAAFRQALSAELTAIMDRLTK